jgi:hypothetical protein
MQRHADSAQSRAWPLVAAGPVAAAGATALSWVLFSVPVFAVWLSAESTDLTWDEVLSICGQVWLAAQGVSMSIFDIPITWLPWGLGAIIVALLYFAGRWAVRVSAATRPSEILIVVLGGALAYAGLATAVSTWVVPTSAGPGRVLVMSAGVAIVALGLGAVNGAQLRPQLLAEIPVALRRVFASATVAVGTWITVGALSLGIALVVSSSDALRLVTELDPDAAGFLALTLITIGYLPSAVMWAVSYLAGTGFTLVDSTVVSPLSGPVATDAASALPGIPLFAVIPGTAPPLLQAAPVLGLVAGLLGGLVLRRRGARGWPLLGEAALAIAIACAALAVLLRASSGSLGVDRLVAVGPNLAPTIGVACVLWAVGYLIVVGPAVTGRLWEDSADDESPRALAKNARTEDEHMMNNQVDQRLLTAGMRPGTTRGDDV